MYWFRDEIRNPLDIGPGGKRVCMVSDDSVKWYQLAAEKGLADAQYTLGFMYFYGHGVEQDYWKAVVWFQRAAEQGHADAQYELCVCYENGHGVARNAVESVRYYRDAAVQGHDEAQCAMGKAYASGEGVPGILKRLWSGSTDLLPTETVWPRTISGLLMRTGTWWSRVTLRLWSGTARPRSTGTRKHNDRLGSCFVQGKESHRIFTRPFNGSVERHIWKRFGPE